MDWIIFSQEVNDTVSFRVSSDAERTRYMRFDKFLTYLNEEIPKIENYDEMLKQLNTFVLILMKSDGTWQVERIPEPEYDFDTLANFNQNLEEKRQLEKEGTLSQSKLILDKEIKNSKEKFKNFFKK